MEIVVLILRMCFKRGLGSVSDSQTSFDQIDMAHTGEPATPADGRRVSRISPSLRATLLASPLLDEFTTGLIVVALPLIRDEFHLTYEQAGFLFTFGSISSMAIEPLVNLLSDHRSKRPFIVSGLLICAMSYLLTSVSTSYGMLLLAFALLFPGLGMALDLAQATLIDAAPNASSHTMTRWTVLAGVGDLLAPLAVGTMTALGLSWRVLSAFGAALWFGAAAVTWPQRFPRRTDLAPTDEDENESPLWRQLTVAVREALRDRTLLRWSAVVLLCTMLDEVFLAFMGLYLRDALHARAWEISLALGSFLAGSMIALVILDRMHTWRAQHGEQVRGERVLLWLALGTLASIAILLAAHTLWLTTIALFFIGGGAAGWYPLAKAAAYDTRPGKTGVVRAVISIGAPFETVLPTIVGIIAGHFGIVVGIAFLGLAPLGVLALLPYGSSTRRRAK